MVNIHAVSDSAWHLDCVYIDTMFTSELEEILRDTYRRSECDSRRVGLSMLEQRESVPMPGVKPPSFSAYLTVSVTEIYPY
jgi:hypothetical protein